MKLLEPTDRLQPAPVCQTKGQVERLYDNTCRCARGNTAVDVSTSVPRGNCTGLEDDTTDNLEKVWCFLENIRDPTDPQSGCYPDVKWSERDGRYWSSQACYQSPDIENGVKRTVDTHDNHIADVSEILNLNERVKTPTSKSETTTKRTTTSTTEKIPIPVFDNDLEGDEFASVLNTIFQSANADTDTELKKN